MYDQEFKNKILHLLKQKTVKEVAQEFNISSTTLYRWSKAKEDSKLIKKFIGIKNYVEAIELAKKHPNDTLIQSQLVTIYIKKEEYDKAEEIAKKYPNYTPIQSQLITIYMNQNKYAQAEEIAKKYPSLAPIQSQLITIYMNQNKYAQAEEIAKKYPNYTPIQSQLITIYMNQNKYAQAEEIAKKYPSHAPIQSQLITIYMNQKKYAQAEEIAKKHPNDILIQSKLVTIYIKRKEYEKVEEIAKKYPSHAPIQSQLITIYMNQKKYDRAEEIAKKYPNHAPIQSQLITIYMNQKKYAQAEELAKKYPNYAPIQSQLITIYINQNKYTQAEKIANKYPNYVPIQSQLITIYIKRKEYDKAGEIAKKYPNDILIQSQLVTIYIKREKYDKAEEIANKYPNYAPIQSQLMTINNKKEIEKVEETLEDAIIQNKNQDFPKEVGEIRNKISKGTISVKDLENLENFKQQIGLENYLLIMMAVYEKLGLSNMCKRLLKQDKILDVKLKSQLMTYFEQKNKIYNLEKWDNLIGWFNERENFIDEVAEKNIEVLEAKETDLPVKKQHLELKVKNSNISEKMVIVTPSKVGEVSEKKNIKNKAKVKVKTLKDILNKPSKEMILDLKIKYYKEMHDLEKRESAIYKYDRLEEILSSEPSIKNFDSLLLMLIGDGNDKEKVEQSIPEQYSGEYKKVLNRINSRKKH